MGTGGLFYVFNKPPIFKHMTQDTITAEIITKFLAKGPKVPLSDEPMFRLVWSSDIKEKRIGTYRDYVAGVFVRERHCCESVLKYNYIQDRWILERWFPPEVCWNEELPDSIKGSYECIYSFEDANYEPLPLNLQVVEFIVNKCMTLKTSEMFKKSYSKALEDGKKKATFDNDLNLLMDEGPLVSQFHDGSAILMPGKDF